MSNQCGIDVESMSNRCRIDAKSTPDIRGWGAGGLPPSGPSPGDWRCLLEVTLKCVKSRCPRADILRLCGCNVVRSLELGEAKPGGVPNRGVSHFFRERSGLCRAPFGTVPSRWRRWR